MPVFKSGWETRQRSSSVTSPAHAARHGGSGMKTREPLGERSAPLAGAWRGRTRGSGLHGGVDGKRALTPAFSPPQAWELLGAFSWAGISPVGLKHPSAARAGESCPAGPVHRRCGWRQWGAPAPRCGPLRWRRVLRCMPCRALRLQGAPLGCTLLLHRDAGGGGRCLIFPGRKTTVRLGSGQKQMHGHASTSRGAVVGFLLSPPVVPPWRGHWAPALNWFIATGFGGDRVQNVAVEERRRRDELSLEQLRGAAGFWADICSKEDLWWGLIPPSLDMAKAGPPSLVLGPSVGSLTSWYAQQTEQINSNCSHHRLPNVSYCYDVLLLLSLLSCCLWDWICQKR